MINASKSTMIYPLSYIMVDMETIGSRLRIERKAAGMTLEGLGDLVGMSKAGIGQIENGGTKAPHPDNLFKIAEALELSPRWLTTGKGQKEGFSKEALNLAGLFDSSPPETKALLKSTADLIRSTQEKK